jgi:hypothetical protein
MVIIKLLYNWNIKIYYKKKKKKKKKNIIFFFAHSF